MTLEPTTAEFLATLAAHGEAGSAFSVAEARRQQLAMQAMDGSAAPAAVEDRVAPVGPAPSPSG